MPSPRRLRLLMLATLVTVVLTLMYVSSLDDAAANDKRTIKDFYHKTMDGMSKGNGPPGQAVLDKVAAAASRDKDGGAGGDKQFASDTKERLKAAEQKAKAKANGKALRPDPPSQIVGVGNSAEGQAKKPKPAADAAPSPKANGDPPETETKEEHAAEMEMNSILKKAPVIIFSKSYCPYSKRAKSILLEKYSIKPEPYVVELDEHKLGSLLQDQLLEKTRRRTVPNIMVNGVSIGGSDEIVELDNAGKLAAKIIDLGNKRVEVSDRPGAVGSRNA
ncbi:glutaredoxin domain-containing protein [Hirsutella rhossiliensis]|uniref:Glutaredoxin domain-containing protein n=1 Tax=Hirsutella rhossiliensis TaxID=111463 RepID=A0A9P8MLW5_9HYPO|nr:glutaredoxin domain-containing protein [Hirsutella rhossiliensis]KAH0957465.1 glutaredoxin domain-containing protein [Hirsutella rhossiliensis]